MDQNAPREDISTKPLKPARVALNVLALCFALSVLGRGLGESFTVFLKPISESFGWDRAQVVSVYSLTWLAGGLTAPLIGRMFDRSGPRTVYALGLLLLGGAFLIAARAQYLWQFQLSIGLCVGIGIALIGNVPNSILLGRWFGPRLPTAMAIVYSAAGGGVLLLLPASQLLIDHLGWLGAYQIFGIILLWLPQFSQNFWILTGFVVCFGSMIGSRGPLLTATAMKIFRGERVGTIYGTISIGAGLGSALGSWSGGLIHDLTHSYNPLIAFSLASVVLGMIPFLFVPALRR